MSGIEDMINKSVWIKTSHIQPHEYVLKQTHPDLFSTMSELLSKNGYKTRFGQKEYLYINIEGYKYWLVDDVLNREKMSNP